MLGGWIGVDGVSWYQVIEKRMLIAVCFKVDLILGWIIFITSVLMSMGRRNVIGFVVDVGEDVHVGGGMVNADPLVPTMVGIRIRVVSLLVWLISDVYVKVIKWWYQSKMVRLGLGLSSCMSLGTKFGCCYVWVFG